MTPRDGEAVDLVASAVVDAVMAARWQCANLQSRWPPAMALDLLRGHAAELASSPLARDQILSQAVDAAAADLEAGRAPLPDGAAFFFRGHPPCQTARTIVRDRVFRHGGVPARVSCEATTDIEQRLRQDGDGDHQLSDRLATEAWLHELLWDDPRLPAEAHTRLIMLCAVPKLFARAKALDPSYARILRRRESPRWRRRRSLVLAAPRQVMGLTAAQPRPWVRSPAAGWLAALGLALAGAVTWILVDS